ncbi:chitin deacetylase 5 isoform B precursor [Tribolium castaneum]|uniref:Chitin deacetylase 5B n=2 Tax=Tribolium castaneum TaxID=7070 RepID=A8W491_TRICA|nr:chitin deacetylase 5 isoform B precursor [Tribolium castaneum]ABW74148.1 chitin deacetylase 5B [Tribolium castaneum]|eukprot:NP_001107799.1 chitin deacetylase 5 isoform B precursor [Tribolium castaneum]
MEMFHLFTTVTLLLASFDISLCQRKVSRNVALGGEVKTVANFNCPEEFGYYPHPNDCTQYYVCVFGGALLESCTGGLMYSHELQTCDWPRNVGCDGAEISGPVAATSASPPSSRTREESRTRYTPPTPPPAQPAAIVTSRGQPRQLQHNQQEIIKQRQQQQLYADAEETLPPAEEVESDRQQRVYRGQPSTIGQVQKDRDGLRHSNAIPTYSGRSERIGVISFGTQQQQQQQQPQQQYSTIDDRLSNDLTLKRRRKRQTQRREPNKLKHTIDYYRHENLMLPQHTHIINHNTSSIKITNPNINLSTASTTSTPMYSDSSKEEESNKATSDYPDFPEQFFGPPASYFNSKNKYESIENPFANPHFDFDKFLSGLREEPPTTTVSSPVNKLKSKPKTTTPPKTQPSDYYYEYEDDNEGRRESNDAPKKIYSSQIKPTLKTLPKPTNDYYYEEEYDYPQKNNNKPVNVSKNGEMKYSAKYQGKPLKAIKTTRVPQIATTSMRPTTKQFLTSETFASTSTVSSTTQKPKYTTRRKSKLTVPTTRSRSKPRQRLTDDDKKIRVDTSSTAPVQPSAISTATATARALYNSSQYNSNNYDPYYALYDDDVELYRDDDYSQQYNNNNNNAAQSQTPHYRRTPSPAIQSTQEEAPKRGNSGYIQNNYNNYQPNSNSDYNDDNSYNSQVEDQNAYRQVNRQPTRTSTRGRGSTHYANGGNIVNNEVTVTVNRGTPASRPRPTLKPSTSIVSKASEFIDIYRYPPSRPAPIYPQPQPDKTAAKCRKDVCLLPDCSCGGKEIPGDLPVEQVPQLVLLTFDDSVNDLNKGLYSDLFEKGRTNPNGCPIAATFYVSHEWTDYSQVQNLYSDGHEIASHTVSHSFGEQFSQKKWTREVAGQREILSAYGGVHLEDVRGMRAPFLSVGGNKMFKMLYDSNFTYDSSMPIYENKPPSWPYTLDYKLFHDCMIPPCPTRSYPGVWEVPMVMWQDLNGGRCSMGDACSNPPDAEGVFKMLTKNFQRHYTTNRAPFGLFYHAAWFTQPHHKEGFINFLDSILEMKDVWLVTNWQAIQWVRDPTPASRLNSFQPFQCDFSNRPKRCNNPKVCNLWHKSGVRYMRTCQPCPDIYPWTGNTGIRSSRIDNDIED